MEHFSHGSYTGMLVQRWAAAAASHGLQIAAACSQENKRMHKLKMQTFMSLTGF